MGTSTSGGLPIRLVQKNGDLIQLHCTDYTFAVQRSVPAIPVPALGERIGADLNLVNVDMRLNCILTDDDCSGTEKTPTAATTTLDFSAVSVFDATGDEDKTDALMKDDGGDVTIANLNGKSFSLRSTYQVSAGSNSITVLFDTSIAPAASTASGLILTAGLNGVADTGAALATAVHTAFTKAGIPFGSAVTSTGGTTFENAFTVGSLTTGKNVVDPASPSLAAFTLTQTEAGTYGNHGGPTFWTDVDKEKLAFPNHQVFGNGSDTHSCKSAGDKMQDLIANVANTHVMGALGDAFNVFGGTTDKGGWGESLTTINSGGSEDYIVGLQIPYNSLLHADTGVDLLPIGYGTRNFILVTGFTSPGAQNAAGNINPASVVFDSRDMLTGIRGTVTTCNFTYNASETTYAAELSFQPIDLIVGL